MIRAPALFKTSPYFTKYSIFMEIIWLLLFWENSNPHPFKRRIPYVYSFKNCRCTTLYLQVDVCVKKNHGLATLITWIGVCQNFLDSEKIDLVSHNQLELFVHKLFFTFILHLLAIWCFSSHAASNHTQKS